MKGVSNTDIALTFDDGPDPEYTPKLLDLLKKHGAKATFFVVGENAERHPELVARIHEEGHVLGIHNYLHYSNWLMRPRTVQKHIRLTSDAIKRITGTSPKYYRPPWGILNVFDYRNIGHLQIVLWSSLFNDWKKRVGAERLYRRMRKKLKPGQVFLLHDCGTTLGADREAPANTIEALSRILNDGRELGYRFVGIDDMIATTERAKKKRKPGKDSEKQEGAEGDVQASIGWVKRVVVACWMLYEKLFHVVFRLRPVGSGHFFNYRIRKYTGAKLDLRDGESLEKGNLIMEIHFENQMLFELGMKSKTTLQIGIRIIREMQNALPDMARELAVVPNGDKVRALFGISMIHRGGESLGFDTIELPKGLFAWMTNQYLKFLIRVIHPDGKGRVKGKDDSMHPRMLIMHREMLLSWADESSPRKRKKERRPAKQHEALDEGEVVEETETLGHLV
ncbi:polysaccharide deacetylase family protein [Cohnella soli]|uniref:Polysaccharide deacetylase family protein n=1 Tax=Cohnella soli TaxID=425005 RepID=A0ABW0HYC1_9BACL